jgi:hypothetical protein
MFECGRRYRRARADAPAPPGRRHDSVTALRNTCNPTFGFTAIASLKNTAPGAQARSRDLAHRNDRGGHPRDNNISHPPHGAAPQ